MATDKEAMQMALDALERFISFDRDGKPHYGKDSIGFIATEALRTALAQPEKEWVKLTKEEARELCVKNVPYVVDMVTALEAKLKEKNT